MSGVRRFSEMDEFNMNNLKRSADAVHGSPDAATGLRVAAVALSTAILSVQVEVMKDKARGAYD